MNERDARGRLFFAEILCDVNLWGKNIVYISEIDFDTNTRR